MTVNNVKKRIKKDIDKFKLILSENNIGWEEIVLFGSTARGIDTKQSDIDVCVISKNNVKNISKLSARLNALAGLNGLNMDVIVTTKKNFETNEISPILNQVRKYGIKI